MLNPQSLFTSFPSTPQLFEMIFKDFAPLNLTALTKFIGTPQNPKPPTKI